MKYMNVRLVMTLAAVLVNGAAAAAFADMIDGTVTYTDGKPAQGTVVYALNNGNPLRVRNNRVMVGEGRPRAITDKMGAFTIEADLRETTAFLAQDMEDRMAYIPASPGAPRVAIVIPDASSTAVSVFNGKSGAPHENVRIIPETLTKDIAFVYEGKTDADGVLRIKSIAPGRYLVTTWHDVPQVGCCFRSVITRASKVEIAPGQSQTVRLGGTDLPSVSGTIMDTDSAPLHGVWVQLLPKDKPAGDDGANITWSAVSERDGSYTIYDVPPGPYNLRVFRRLVQNDSSRTFEAIQPVRVFDDTAARKPYNVMVDLAPFMPLEPGQDAPDISGVTLAGEPFSLHDNKGKTIVLHFYASWCTPCVQSMDDFDTLAEEYDSSKVVVLGVSLDQTEEEARAFVQEKGVKHPVIFQGTWAENPIREAYRVSNIPTTVIIGPDGKILNIDLFGGPLRKYLGQRLARANSFNSR